MVAGMTQTPRLAKATAEIEFRLNRAAALLSEVDSLFSLGISSQGEIAADETAHVQMLIATANAHLRSAEIEMAFQTWRGETGA